MNPTRLFVLGALARHGAMYGHQIRRDARMGRAELWSDVRPGSLYSALHKMADEGLVEPVRTEQSGKMPARTVYAITAEGQRELRALRAEALQEIAVRPDPVDLALVMSGDLDPGILRGYVEDRIRALAAQAGQHAHQGERTWPGSPAADDRAADDRAADDLAADDLVAEHMRLRIEAELAWHQTVLDRITKLTGESAS